MSASRPSDAVEGQGYSRPSLQRRELRRSGRALGQRCLCWAQAMTQTLVWCLDLIKCSSFPSCFPLHSSPAGGIGLTIRSLGHACLPSSSATSAPSYLLETCFMCHRCHSVPVLLCAYHTPSQGPPASPLLSFPLCLAVPSGPGKNTACPRVVESSSPGVCHLEPCSLFLVACQRVFLPPVLHP